MGLFDFLFGKKTKIEGSLNVNTPNYYTPEYYKLLDQRPHISKFWGRDFDFPDYDDTFITQEGYKLRELLLLIWWGKTKNGRKSTASIPKYFFYTYNLNAEKLTREFKSSGLLIDIDEKTVLSEKGKNLFSKYKQLWEIHSTKNYPTNLDVDFPTWDKELSELALFQMEVQYYKEHANYCEKMIAYFDSYRASNSSEIFNEINYYVSERGSDLAKVNDFQEKIAVLKEKINKKSTKNC